MWGRKTDKGWRKATKAPQRNGLDWDYGSVSRRPSGISSTLTEGFQLSYIVPYIAGPMSTEQRYLVHGEARIGRFSRPNISRHAEVCLRAFR